MKSSQYMLIQVPFSLALRRRSTTKRGLSFYVVCILLEVNRQYVWVVDSTQALFVNVTADELRHVDVDPQHQLRLLEGGFIASLEVYHHLHCIVSLDSHHEVPAKTVQ
jgi:hypothetical protein